MKKITSLLFLLCLGTILLTAQRQRPKVDSTLKMDFEIYDPPSTLVVPENPVYRARFPFVDIHSHHWRLNDKPYLDKIMKEMDSLNMKIIVNLSGRGGKRLKAMQDVVDASPYANRFINFTNIELRSIDDPDWTESTVQQLEYDAKVGAKGLKIYKSQGMTNEDSSGNRIRIDDPRIDAVWAKCGELGIPVLIHSADPASFWKPHDENNERWLELKLRPGRKRNPADFTFEQIIAEQHHIFKKHPNTTFIAAHMGWYPNDLKKLAGLLDDMPNVYVEIGAIIAELGRQPKMANWFFEKYQDRVLFGKDSYKPKEYPTYFRVLETADEHFSYYKKYHAFWKMYGLDLPDEILKKLYYKNALKVIPGLDASLFEEAETSRTDKTGKQLRHVVLFKFKETSSTADIQKVEDAFLALPSKIAAISDFEWGTNNSPEGLDKGFTHVFFVSFESEADRGIYLPHPAHQAFVKVLQPHLEDVLVMDYWTP